jgi:hypothetical protein
VRGVEVDECSLGARCFGLEEEVAG